MAHIRSFRCCAICGGIGHVAGSCALRQLEERKDPVGEQRRRQAMYERRREVRMLRMAALGGANRPFQFT